MAKMKDIDVKGRGLIRGRVTVRPTAEGLSIEVDDEQNPEMWLHVHIDRDFLRSLLVSVDAHQGAAGEFFNNGRPLPDVPGPDDWLPEIPPGANVG